MGCSASLDRGGSSPISLDKAAADGEDSSPQRSGAEARQPATKNPSSHVKSFQKRYNSGKTSDGASVPSSSRMNAAGRARHASATPSRFSSVQGEQSDAGPVQPTERSEPGKTRRRAVAKDVLLEPLRRQGAGQDLVGASDDEESAPEPDHEFDSDDLTSDQKWLVACLLDSFVFHDMQHRWLVRAVSKMRRLVFPRGTQIVGQGDIVGPQDYMVVVQEGEIDVVIYGSLEELERMSEGNPAAEVVQDPRDPTLHSLRFPQGPGKILGDLAMLFNSPRSATMLARTDCVVWGLTKEDFMKEVMLRAPWTRALAFVRRVPFFTGVTDTELLNLVTLMTEETYADGELIIRRGERDEKVYVVRHGTVGVLAPDTGSEVIQLGRGHVIGERVLIGSSMRTADCIARGEVTVMVLQKQDILKMESPIFEWMLDYEILLSVANRSKYLSQFDLEKSLDDFQREIYKRGTQIVKAGDVPGRVWVLRTGEITAYDAEGRDVGTDAFEVPYGFIIIGGGSQASTMTVEVATEEAVLLAIDNPEVTGTREQANIDEETRRITLALAGSHALRKLPEEVLTRLSELGTYMNFCEFSSGDVIYQGGDPVEEVMTVVHGEVTVKSIKGERVVRADEVYGLEEMLSASPEHPGDVEVASDRAAIAFILYQDIVAGVERLLSQVGSGSRSAIHDGLELLGELGSGQFGSVFLVREPGTGTLNALKVISKEAVHEPKQVEHLQSEARIQAELQSDFCVRLVDKAQDSCALYLLQEFVPGGELFYILDVAGALKETDVRFYAGNVLLGLEYMHSKGIVYRDLKPENLLIGPDGYIKLADFGFAKKTPGRRTFTLCGTPDYQAPEVITRKGTGPAADYWALGVLIYELLSGDAPFKGGTEDPWDTFRRILSGRFFIPPFMSTTAADLIYKLLQVNPDTRLGSGPAGALEIRRHRFFAGVNWKALEQHRVRPPFVPDRAFINSRIGRKALPLGRFRALSRAKLSAGGKSPAETLVMDGWWHLDDEKNRA